MTWEAVVVRKRAALGAFERYLSLWVALCIVTGIYVGSLAPEPFHELGSLNVANVNMPVAALIWLMIVPMLLASISARSPGDAALARHASPCS